MTPRFHGSTCVGLSTLAIILASISGCAVLRLTSTGQGQSATQSSKRDTRQDGRDNRDNSGIRQVAFAADRIQPRQAIYWAVESQSIKPSRFMSGAGVVGPDGKLEIGPYGCVRVANLKPEQARKAIEKHLSKYLRYARVSIKPVHAVQKTQTALRPTYPTWSRGETQTSATWRPVKSSAQPEMTTLAANWNPRTETVSTSWSRNPIHSTRFQQPTSTSDGTEDAPELPTDPNLLAKDGKGNNPKGKVPPHLLGLHTKGATSHQLIQAPTEMTKRTMPPYMIEAPDLLLVESTQSLTKDQPVRGQHMVRPDGTINLGIYGSVYVAGMTLDQAREAVTKQLAKRINDVTEKNVNVDVLAYNSKVYYIITDGGGYGEQVVRVPFTGNETVLDALGLINGLPPVASKKHIWVARRASAGPGSEQILAVDWIGITQRGATDTNFQVMPGDRIYVKADKLRTFDANLAKFLSPLERVLGVTLLGSETRNSIRGTSTLGR